MSLLDCDIDINKITEELILEKLKQVYLKHMRIDRPDDQFNFKLNFEHDINRIKRPELYHICYNYETSEYKMIYDKIDITFWLCRNYNKLKYTGYPLNITLKDLYEFA